MSVVDDYTHAIVRRAREPMEPRDFVPNWADQPRRHKYHPGARLFPLPEAEALPGTLHGGLSGFPVADRRWTLGALSALLRETYGLTGRRLAVHGNPDLRGMPWFPSATWSRGVASGGGLYPLEIYWVTGPSGPLTPGIYHHSTPHHAMGRLLAGDVTADVRRALPDDSTGTDQFLLVTVKFWKNSFKYNSFSYHAVTMDVGALLGAWCLAARAAGLPLTPHQWFDEPALNRLLGLDPRDESVFAVLPLPWDAQVPTGSPTVEPTFSPAVRLSESERSREVVRFPQVVGVHEETMMAAKEVPDPHRFEAARRRPSPPNASRRLPLPRPLEAPVVTALRERRSSFGRFSAVPPLSQTDLSTVLNAATDGSMLLEDAGLTRLSILVNHVDGLSPGSYDVTTDGCGLRTIEEHYVAGFLQRNYFLNNYNLEQCAAVITVLASPSAVTAAVGARGYRQVNAEVGAVAQTVYLACAAIGIGCGAALGFDNVSYREELQVTDEAEWPLLILMIGHERAGQPEFVSRNV